jgi:hypothetical protein
MQLLGTYYTNEGRPRYYLDHLYVGKFTWLLQYNGAGGITSGGTLVALGTYSETNRGYNASPGNVTPYSVFGLVLSWTTGTVSVTAVHGPFATVLARHGFDNRDAHGSGEIQLVTPMLTRWVWLGGNYETADIGVLKLTVPEPQAWLMLGAGLSMLGLLYRSNRRSR